MASIIQDDLQAKALDEINKMLNEVRNLNQRINSEKPFLIQSGRKQSIELDAIYDKKIRNILQDQRMKRVKDIRLRAFKFRIALSDEEEKMIDDEAIKETGGQEISAEEPEEEPETI